MTHQTSKETASASQNRALKVGQLVSIDGDKLGEITETIWSGFFRVWIERDGPGQYATVHESRMEAITA